MKITIAILLLLSACKKPDPILVDGKEVERTFAAPAASTVVFPKNATCDCSCTYKN